MKILEVIPALGAGGGERFVVDLSNELAKDSSNKVELLIVKDENIANNGFYKKNIKDNVKFTSLKIKKYSFFTIFKLYREIKKREPDIVHYHLSGMISVLFFTIFFYRKPVYFQTLHGRADKQQNNVIDLFLRKFIYQRKLVNLITISIDNDDIFRSFYKTDSLATIYNGRAEDLPQNFEEVKKEIDSYKMNENTLVYIHVARFHPEKNQPLLINSFNKYLENGANAILLILGANYDSNEAQSLLKKAHKNIYCLGIKNNVFDYLKCSDAFVLSSLNEGMPISLIEAMACKCALLSTPVSGCVDLIKNGVNGFVAEDFSEDSLLKIITNYDKQHKNINKDMIYDYYCNNLSIQKCAKSYKELFDKYIKH